MISKNEKPKAILFGASKLGEITFNILKHEYNIIYFSDNNQQKWDTKFLDLTIINPNSLKLYSDAIIIITSMYWEQIRYQLIDLNINNFVIAKDSIFNNHCILNKIKTSDYILTSKKIKRFLFMIDFYSPLFINLIKNIKSNLNEVNCIIDILTSDSRYGDSDLFNNIYIFSGIQGMQKFFTESQEYDFIHIHYVSTTYCYLANTIRSMCNKLIISFWGSDFYKTDDNEKALQMIIINLSNVITIANEQTASEFKKTFSIKSTKIKIIRFGLSILDYINNLYLVDKNKIKRDLGIPVDKIVVTCGYNGSINQNHIKIIEQIYNLSKEELERIFLIIPMTYGGTEEYFNIIDRKLNNRVSYKIYKNFLSEITIAKLRVISDIMVQVQDTDQFSGSMQEAMFCKNIVLTGDWLPYDILKKNGVFFIECCSFNEISKKLKFIINNLQMLKVMCEKNGNIIWQLSSWETNIKSWISLYK